MWDVMFVGRSKELALLRSTYESCASGSAS